MAGKFQGSGAAGMNTIGALTAGAVAGAAGTTALNAVTYLDMVWRGRPASSTPEATVRKLADVTGISIPGAEEERTNRIAGVGPLLGILAGVSVGAALGGLRAAGYRPGLVGTSLTAVAGALVVGNGPMTALGVTDPRTWSRTDWLSDVVPHLAYGIAAGAALEALDPAPRSNAHAQGWNTSITTH
ncbi:hypothetical protein [Arthrobacter pascens]|uniref:hypothetical protein n=1 Tax=Arthrobacter pascens TaxID=1677 RepID=UPI00196BA85C|nr:hypothetical protein [Arthrobacter pascens]MBN3496694.1 hypothetical protein [Arthrobacter pascens]